MTVYIWESEFGKILSDLRLIRSGAVELKEKPDRPHSVEFLPNGIGLGRLGIGRRGKELAFGELSSVGRHRARFSHCDYDSTFLVLGRPHITMVEAHRLSRER